MFFLFCTLGFFQFFRTPSALLPCGLTFLFLSSSSPPLTSPQLPSVPQSSLPGASRTRRAPHLTHFASPASALGHSTGPFYIICVIDSCLSHPPVCTRGRPGMDSAHLDPWHLVAGDGTEGAPEGQVHTCDGSSQSAGLRSWVSAVSLPVISGKIIKPAFLRLQFPIFFFGRAVRLMGS